ncbi:MAG: BPSS1780 family membrane protein [Rubrivivax sp.]
MPLSLKPVPAVRGAHWVREAFRLFLRRPLGFTGLFMAFLFVALLVMFVPLIGGVLQMMLLPLLSLGFMVASTSALRGGPVHPGHFVEPLTGAPDRRRALLKLCVLYGLAAVALLWFSNWIADGQLLRLQAQLASGQPDPQELDALAAARGVFVGTLVLITGATLLSVPFWHAPALVHWGGQSAGHALFSSTLAVWRAKGAFLVYSLAWTGIVLGVGLGTAVLLGLLGAPQFAGVLALPTGLLFSTVFYVSLLFTFNDSFGDASDQPPAAPPLPPAV